MRPLRGIALGQRRGRHAAGGEQAGDDEAESHASSGRGRWR